MKLITCPSALLLLCALLDFQTVSAQSTSNFAPVTLPRGIEILIPKGWWLLSADHNRSIQTSVEAAIDLSGLELPEGQETNLIAVNSMPRTTYAAARIDSTIPSSVEPSELALVTPAEIRALQAEMHQGLEKLLPLQGNRLLEFLDLRIERISGHPAIVTEYRRTGPKGPVFVQINQVFTRSQEIRINLSYRESEVALWKPVVGKIRQSVVIKGRP